MNDNYYVILELTYDLKVEIANNDVHIFCNVLLKPIGDLSIIVHTTESKAQQSSNNVSYWLLEGALVPQWEVKRWRLFTSKKKMNQ